MIGGRVVGAELTGACPDSPPNGLSAEHDGGSERPGPCSSGPGLSGGRSARCLEDRNRACGGLALVLESGEPVEPAGQVPVPVAEQHHRSGEQHGPDDRRVEEDGDCEPDAGLEHAAGKM